MSVCFALLVSRFSSHTLRAPRRTPPSHVTPSTPGRRLPLQRPIRLPEQISVDLVQQIGELELITRHIVRPSPSDHKVGNQNEVISELNSPACTPPVNASPPPSRLADA